MSGAGNLSSHDAVNEYWRARTHVMWMEQCSSANLFTNGTSTAGSVGWAYQLPLLIRHELFLLLDNGWQEGSEADSYELVLNRERFPEIAYDSPDPTRSLMELRKHVQALGWRGLGVWVNGAHAVEVEGFQRLHAAGVGLLKFDGGDAQCLMTARARKRRACSSHVFSQYFPPYLVCNG